MGQVSSSWSPIVDRHHNTVIKIKFSSTDCGTCPAHALCTRAIRRSISLRPERAAQALQVARQREQTETFTKQYAQRAGIEAALSQGVCAFGLRRSRYFGLAKTHLQHVLTAVAINFTRIVRWLDGQPLAKTRKSAFVRLCRPTPL